jgi:hypothetical protein
MPAASWQPIENPERRLRAALPLHRAAKKSVENRAIRH